MKKLVIFLCAVAVLLGALLAGAGLAVDAMTAGAVSYIRDEGPKHGVTVLGVDFEDAIFQLPASVYWIGVTASLRMDRETFLPQGREVTLRIDKLSFGLESLGEGTFLLKAGRVFVDLPGEDESLVEGREGEVLFRLESLRPRRALDQARRMAGELRALLLTGKTKLPLTFTGVASFRVKGELLRCGVTVKRRGDYSVLMIRESDVQRISLKFDLESPLTEAEVKLVSLNPLKSHRLLQIRTYARKKSANEHRLNRAVPEDAYRHVLWSYLLTREFGEEFALEVTEAHEVGKTGNTRAETLMDHENNRTGREYAGLDIGEKAVLERLMADGRVVRAPPGGK